MDWGDTGGGERENRDGETGAKYIRRDRKERGKGTENETESMGDKENRGKSKNRQMERGRERQKSIHVRNRTGNVGGRVAGLLAPLVGPSHPPQCQTSGAEPKGWRRAGDGE